MWKIHQKLAQTNLIAWPTNLYRLNIALAIQDFQYNHVPNILSGRSNLIGICLNENKSC